MPEAVSQRFVMLTRSGVVVGVSFAIVLCLASNVMAQALKDVQTSDTPLVLKAQGSFFVGGEKVEQTRSEVGDFAPGGHIAVNQMYVRYMVPQGGLLAIARHEHTVVRARERLAHDVQVRDLVIDQQNSAGLVGRDWCELAVHRGILSSCATM